MIITQIYIVVSPVCINLKSLRGIIYYPSGRGIARAGGVPAA